MTSSGDGDERFSYGFAETEIQDVIKDSIDLSRLMLTEWPKIKNL